MLGADATDKFFDTLDLFEAGVLIMEQNLRRRFPQESDEEIEQRLDDWLNDRPGYFKPRSTSPR